uniref:H/ACA ribonucleoprotein complex non-core subunit NAF1 n=1 Tax=Esox lucius TaxID=8010 RepID=A0A6Q2YPN5_ESOLU
METQLKEAPVVPEVVPEVAPVVPEVAPVVLEVAPVVPEVAPEEAPVVPEVVPEEAPVVPEETFVFPTALQDSTETHADRVRSLNGTSPELWEDANSTEAESQEPASGTQDRRLQGQLPERAEDMEVIENVTPLDPPEVLLPLRDRVSVGHQSDESSSSSDSDSSSSSCVTLAAVLGDVDDDDDEEEGFRREKKPIPIKTVDEILPEELPEVEELLVVLPEEAELLPMGTVTSIIEQLVVVQSLKDTPPLKDDSVIFNSERLAVGKVFEVFGPVSSPFYVLRFNSDRDIINKGVKLRDCLFYAPSLTDYTLYILTEQLRMLKGSDASWKNDQEPPPEALDFSDDEAEQMMKRKKKGNIQKRERERGQRTEQPDGVSVTRSQMSQRPLHKSRPPHRDNWGPPPRYEGASFYPPPQHSHPQSHYSYPPPYQPQSFPLYPPPPPHLSFPWPPPHSQPYHSLPFSHLPPPPPSSPTTLGSVAL